MGVDGELFVCEGVGWNSLFLLTQGLREMLLSDENQLMKPEHRNTIYQDMTKPLTFYWINTSHNTYERFRMWLSRIVYWFRYLCANQVVGICTGESYVQALKRGCRSVECE